MKKHFIVRVAIFVLCITPVRVFADTEKCDIGYWSYQETTHVFDAADGAVSLIEGPFHLRRTEVDSVKNNRVYWRYNGRQIFAMCEALVEHPALTEWSNSHAEQTLSGFSGTFDEAVITATLTENDPIVARFLIDQVRLHIGRISTRPALSRSDHLKAWREYSDYVRNLRY